MFIARSPIRTGMVNSDFLVIPSLMITFLYSLGATGLFDFLQIILAVFSVMRSASMAQLSSSVRLELYGFFEQ